MATTFYCGVFVDGKPKNCSEKSATSPGRAAGLTPPRALMKELVPLTRTFAAAASTADAAFGIFSRLEVTHVNFIFLLFAHITFLSCVYGFGLCQSRRIVAVPLRPFRLGSGRPNGSAYLSNASAVELHAPQNLRPSFPSTNSHAHYYHYLCHEIFGPPYSAIYRFKTKSNNLSYSHLRSKLHWVKFFSHHSNGI